jgi:hypothetical protein
MAPGGADEEAAADPEAAADDAAAVALLEDAPDELDEQPATRRTAADAARTLNMRNLQRG